MPSATPTWGLPYPLASDAPNVPLDMKNLADAVDADLSTLLSSVNTLTTNLNSVAGGLVALNRPTTNSDATTTETFVDVATLTLVNGRGYKVTAAAAQANLTAPSSATFRFRWKAGGTVDATGTEEYRVINDVTGSVRKSPDHTVSFVWAGATGTYTIGFSIQSTANVTRWYGDTKARTFEVLDTGA